MKKFCLSLALAGSFLVPALKSSAIALDDIQLWTGSGTNRAALVIEWSTPANFSTTSVAAPATDKTLVWGYRFNGSASGLDMLNAILLADHRLYSIEEFGGSFIVGFGYNLKGDGNIGITDGAATNYFPNGILSNPTVDVDAAHPLNPNDLYWAGYFGPNWETWNELGDQGGFQFSPSRGTNQFWTPDDTNNPFSGTHGEWELAQNSLDGLMLTNGSWIGYSVAAGGDIYTNDSDPSTIAYEFGKHAPPSPDGTYFAYVCNTNDFAVQVLSSSNLFSTPYDDATATLDRPTLKFLDHFTPHQVNIVHRTKIVEPPYWTDSSSNKVITEITSGGEITVQLGRKIYDDPNNPYGIDFTVYGNSFFSASGFTGSEVTDFTDLDVAKSSSGIFGHATYISVSQDGLNWVSLPSVSVIFPDDSYRWDATNHAWTDEEMNPTKPLNPAVVAESFGGHTVASDLDQFVNASGGSGFDLKSTGLPWIQYLRFQPGTNTSDYTVIDAIAATDPAVLGDALSIAPANLAVGVSNLVFQNPAEPAETLVSLNFDSVSDIAKVSTIGLSELSSFGPIVGALSSAYQITLKPITNTTIAATAELALRAGDAYSGDGHDLRVSAWTGANFALQPFAYNPATKQVLLTAVTNFSAFVISQIIPPQLSAQASTNGVSFQFVPVSGSVVTLQRSTDFKTWTPIGSMTPTNSQPVTMQDFSPPADKAFYRLHMVVP